MLVLQHLIAPALAEGESIEHEIFFYLLCTALSCFTFFILMKSILLWYDFHKKQTVTRSPNEETETETIQLDVPPQIAKQIKEGNPVNCTLSLNDISSI